VVKTHTDMKSVERKLGLLWVIFTHLLRFKILVLTIAKIDVKSIVNTLSILALKTIENAEAVLNKVVQIVLQQCKNCIITNLAD
jgi:hypothetical protein